MLVEVKAILPDGLITIKKLDDSPLPQEGKKYIPFGLKMLNLIRCRSLINSFFH